MLTDFHRPASSLAPAGIGRRPGTCPGPRNLVVEDQLLLVPLGAVVGDIRVRRPGRSRARQDARKVRLPDEHRARLGALVTGDDAEPFHLIDQAPCARIPDAQAPLGLRNVVTSCGGLPGSTS